MIGRYDQWKTASPYDDMPDPTDDAERWLQAFSELQEDERTSMLEWANSVIEQLLDT